jgi:excisionase family DNA binding protein
MHLDDTPESPLLKASEVADRFRVTTRTVRRWVNAGQLPGVTLPSGRVRYRQSDVERILATAGDEQATA